MGSKTAVRILALIGALLFILWVGLILYGFIGPGYIFENTVHSHMENAYWAADPTTMKSQLLEAKAGMRELGLREDMYGAVFPWDKVPKNSMVWQYQHIDSLLVRTDEFIQWEQSLTTTSTAQVKDVYTEKLNNMRSFLQEGGWSDDIARNTFWLNNYLWLIILEYIIPVLILLILLMSWLSMW